jgi:hypothetical protein
MMGTALSAKMLTSLLYALATASGEFQFSFNVINLSLNGLHTD